MKAYSYDRDTKEYVGEVSCQPAPVDGGFLIPGHATDIKPEQSKEGHVMIFKDEGWVEVVDHRGFVYLKDDKDKLIEWKDVGELPPHVTPKEPREFDTHWDESKQKWVGHDEHLKKIEDDLKKQLEYEASYVFKRRQAYPPLFEQLDALYWDMKNGTNNWVDSRTKVKEKYPKDKE